MSSQVEFVTGIVKVADELGWRIMEITPVWLKMHSPVLQMTVTLEGVLLSGSVVRQILRDVSLVEATA